MLAELKVTDSGFPPQGAIVLQKNKGFQQFYQHRVKLLLFFFALHSGVVFATQEGNSCHVRVSGTTRQLVTARKMRLPELSKKKHPGRLIKTKEFLQITVIFIYLFPNGVISYDPCLYVLLKID